MERNTPARAVELSVVIDRLSREQSRQYLEALTQHSTPGRCVHGVAKRGELAHPVVTDAESQHETPVREEVQRYRLAREHRWPTPHKGGDHGTDFDRRGGRRDSGETDVGIENVANAGP